MSALLLAWASSVSAAQEESPGFLFLRHLARHQMKDGSWGGWAASCACPRAPEPAPAPADPKLLERLLRQLGEDAPETRDAAEAELRSIGDPAIPDLEAGAAHSDSEVRVRCLRIRAGILARERGEGDLETTGLALLSFLGAGYSHLSKDTYDEICLGETIRRGLRWIAGRQDADGWFDRKDAAANAVAALALCEAYGLTGSNLYKEAAQRGVAAVEQTDPKDLRDLAWKGMVVASARLFELEGDHAKQAAKTIGALRDSDLLRSKAVRAYLRAAVLKEKEEGVTASIASSPPGDLDPETRVLATLALYAHEGRSGATWKAWSPRLKESIVPAQRLGRDGCRRGSWGGADPRGRLRTTALNGLALEVYYRYPGVLGCSK